MSRPARASEINQELRTIRMRLNHPKYVQRRPQQILHRQQQQLHESAIDPF